MPASTARRALLNVLNECCPDNWLTVYWAWLQAFNFPVWIKKYCWFVSSRVRVLPRGGRGGVGVRSPGFSDDLPHLLHRHALLRQQDLSEGSTFRWLSLNKRPHSRRGSVIAQLVERPSVRSWVNSTDVRLKYAPMVRKKYSSCAICSCNRAEREDVHVVKKDYILDHTLYLVDCFIQSLR